MLSQVKEELLKNQDAIVALLEYFDFAHIKPSRREIRFSRDEHGGSNISLRLENLILLCNHLGFLSVCGNVCIPFHGRLYTSRGVGAKVPTSILVASSFGASLF